MPQAQGPHQVLFVIGLLFSPALAVRSIKFTPLLQLFADAELGIHCPSGNEIYVHPISGDLQQCSQQLGSYNETSCPGGTSCERFPILIPGFQDYCCWSNDTSDQEGGAIASTVTVPRELRPFTEKPTKKIIPTVEAIIEKPPASEEEEEEETIAIPVESIIEIERPEVDERENGRIVVTAAPEEAVTETEWEFETTTRPKRPRSRKLPTTTTQEPETTTIPKKVVSNRRLPRCKNSDDSIFLDRNRLRDCYFHPCPKNYRCEFNTEIRRFICCGREGDMLLPPGLPPLPNPKPLLPPRRRPQPFGMLNDGEVSEESDEHFAVERTTPVARRKSSNHERKEGKNSNGCRWVCPNTESNIDEYGNEKRNGCPPPGFGCENMERGPDRVSPSQPRKETIRRPEDQYPNNRVDDRRPQTNNPCQPMPNGCPMVRENNCCGSYQLPNERSNNVGTNARPNSRPPPPPAPMPVSSRKESSSFGQTNNRQGPSRPNFERGSNNQQGGSNQNNRGQPNIRQGPKPQERRRPENQETNGDYEYSNKPIRKKLVKPQPIDGEFADNYGTIGQENYGPMGQIQSFGQGTRAEDTFSRPEAKNGNSQGTCSMESEYRDATGGSPRCIPPGTDACPLSHPICLQSQSRGHAVCCQRPRRF